MNARSTLDKGVRAGSTLGTALILGVLLLETLGCARSGTGIAEGPWLQRVEGTGAVIRWFAPGHGEMELRLSQAGNEKALRVAPEGGRYRVALTDLLPDTTAAYRILEDGRILFRSELRTARSRGEPITFAVFGDSGEGSPQQAELARRIAAEGPDFILHTGDVVYPEGARAGYAARFFAPYRDLISKVCLWPALGNHDFEGPEPGKAFREVFELPRNGPGGADGRFEYRFDSGSAQFVFLDTELERKQLRADVAPWLERVLAEDGPRFRFVVMHRPAFASYAEPYHCARVEKILMPIFAHHGVDAVFMGHRHFYERTHPIAGVVYVISGGGGGEADLLKPVGEREPWSAAAFNEDLSFTMVSIDGDHLTLRQIARDGRVVDEWEKTKGD